MSDNDYGIKPEWRESWKINSEGRCDNGICDEDNLADLSAHLLAGLMESEFHVTHSRTAQIDLHGCFRGICCDPRHNYDYDDWLAAAKGELGK